MQVEQCCEAEVTEWTHTHLLRCRHGAPCLVRCSLIVERLGCGIAECLPRALVLLHVPLDEAFDVTLELADALLALRCEVLLHSQAHLLLANIAWQATGQHDSACCHWRRRASDSNKERKA